MLVRAERWSSSQWIDEGRMAQGGPPVQLIFLIWSSTQHYGPTPGARLSDWLKNKAEL